MKSCIMTTKQSNQHLWMSQLQDSLLQLEDAEMQIGLPKIEIDHANGVVLVGPGGDPETEAFRSIKVEFDEDRWPVAPF